MTLACRLNMHKTLFGRPPTYKVPKPPPSKGALHSRGSRPEDGLNKWCIALYLHASNLYGAPFLCERPPVRSIC